MLSTSIKEICDYSPDMLGEIMRDIHDKSEREAVELIINLFFCAGLRVRIRKITPKSSGVYYRVVCHIRQSKESVIINTRNEKEKTGVFNGLNIQIRIDNRQTLENLAALSDNTRNSIIAANDCVYCTPKCEGKRYLFAYEGKEYVKCCYICSNFRFRVKSSEDVDSIVRIVQSEISKSKQRE